MDDVWGPWIEHDGKGCPADIAPGVWAALHFWWPDSGSEKIKEGRISANMIGDEQWHWPRQSKWSRPCVVKAYRIRKPRALTMLQEIARDVPSREGVDA